MKSRLHQLPTVLLFISLSLSGCKSFHERQQLVDNITQQTSAVIEEQRQAASKQLAEHADSH